MLSLFWGVDCLLGDDGVLSGVSNCDKVSFSTFEVGGADANDPDDVGVSNDVRDV